MMGKRRGSILASGLFVALVGVGGVSLFAEGALELTGRLERSEPTRSTGGSFVVEGLEAGPTTGSLESGLVLTRTESPKGSADGGGCGCLGRSLFADGFESGDTTAWSATTP